MLLSRSILSGCLLAAAIAGQDDPADPTGVVAPTLDRARFDELRELLTPEADAPWRSIAWRIDLLAAQREAAAAQKPLFIWAMDGHPLGCT